MNVEKLFAEWRACIGDAAKSRADVVYLTEYRKSKKAILMNEARVEGFKTGQERESYAYAHQDYLDLLLALKEATIKSEKYRWQMEIAKERIQIYRTHEASRRAEFKSYGN